MVDIVKNPDTISASDYLVVRASDLQNIRNHFANLIHSVSTEGCEKTEFVGDLDYLRALDASLNSFQTETVPRAVRRVDGDKNSDDGNEPALVVIPPGMTDSVAIGHMNAAIESSGQATRNGENGMYWEELQIALSASGIAIESGVESLSSRPWDANSILQEQPRERQSQS